MQMQFTPSDTERFWSKVDKSGECWTYSGQPSQTFPHISVRGKQYRTSRVAYALTGNAIPDGFFVCHTCDNPRCCRNDEEGWYEVNGVLRPRRGHLWLGTAADNNADRDAKGRTPTGEESWSYLHPERLARGEHSGQHTHPERTARGSRHGLAKLTDALVREMRARYAAGGISHSQLAREYDIHPSNAWFILTRRTWTHIE